MPTAQTRINTDRASRYLVQLCEHLKRLDQRRRHSGGASHGPGVQHVECTDTRGVIEFAFGQCELQATDDILHIRLTADDPEALRRMRDLFTNRIETIGRRDHLAVNWVSPRVD
jgi:hypothetical protein